jgi:hypothetical protein
MNNKINKNIKNNNSENIAFEGLGMNTTQGGLN